MGPAVHLELTRVLALDEGFSDAEAEAIAHADIAFDARYPARASLANVGRHFAPWAWIWSERYLGMAIRDCDLEMLGYALHCAQDGVAHGRLGTRHLGHMLGILPSPDVWETTPRPSQRRIEEETRGRLRRYRELTGCVAPF